MISLLKGFSVLRNLISICKEPRSYLYSVSIIYITYLVYGAFILINTLLNVYFSEAMNVLYSISSMSSIGILIQLVFIFVTISGIFLLLQSELLRNKIELIYTAFANKDSCDKLMKLVLTGKKLEIYNALTADNSLYEIMKCSLAEKDFKVYNSLLTQDLCDQAAELFPLNKDEHTAKTFEFSLDASELMIFAGDASFLLENDRIHLEILKKCVKNGGNVRLLIKQDSICDDDVLEIVDSGVKVRKYNSDFDIGSLRGRIRKTPQGRRVLLFDKRKDMFWPFPIKHQVILNMLYDRYDAIFKEGKCPVVKHISIDLDGVNLRGDIEAFKERIKNMLGDSVAQKLSNSLFDEKILHLDRHNFVRHLKEMVQSVTLLEQQIEGIVCAWEETRCLYEIIPKLVEKIRSLKYEISCLSSFDEDNFKLYGSSSMLNNFHYKFTASAIEDIIEKIDKKPHECIFIVGSAANNRKAEKAGAKVIWAYRGQTPKSLAQNIQRELCDFGIPLHGWELT
ncbi:MAG: hypothetical protein R6W72_02325 [Desulfurivibrionaceae bacterium]